MEEIPAKNEGIHPSKLLKNQLAYRRFVVLPLVATRHHVANRSGIFRSQRPRRLREPNATPQCCQVALSIVRPAFRDHLMLEGGRAGQGGQGQSRLFLCFPPASVR
jgi:hypothetical protein